MADLRRIRWLPGRAHSVRSRPVAPLEDDLDPAIVEIELRILGLAADARLRDLDERPEPTR